MDIDFPNVLHCKSLNYNPSTYVLSVTFSKVEYHKATCKQELISRHLVTEFKSQHIRNLGRLDNCEDEVFLKSEVQCIGLTISLDLYGRFTAGVVTCLRYLELATSSGVLTVTKTVFLETWLLESIPATVF